MTDISGEVEHDRDFETSFNQKAGPLTPAGRTVFFDLASPDIPVVLPGDEEPVEGAMIRVQPLVNPDRPDGPSLLGVRYAPYAEIPRHKHDVAQIVVVLEGELHQGNRAFGPGQGYYTPAHGPYAIKAGPDGVRVIEFRPGWLRFTTDWV